MNWTITITMMKCFRRWSSSTSWDCQNMIKTQQFMIYLLFARPTASPFLSSFLLFRKIGNVPPINPGPSNQKSMSLTRRSQHKLIFQNQLPVSYPVSPWGRERWTEPGMMVHFPILNAERCRTPESSKSQGSCPLPLVSAYHVFHPSWPSFKMGLEP